MKKILLNIIEKALDRPWLFIALAVFISIGFAALVPRIKIDTDPENMLSKTEVVRIAHERAKLDFSLYDTIALGVIDEARPRGVFRPETLARISAITTKIEKIEGVIARDIISPTTTDDISSDGAMLVIEPLMKQGVLTRADALYIRDRARANPVLNNLLISEDGRALTLFIPIAKKDQSHRIYMEIERIIDAQLLGAEGATESYYVAGLPVAEDTFGVEMFREMGVSAPLAGLVIFILLLIFFRRPLLVVSSMAVAMMTVIWTMGLLIGAGFTVHILSSMIPVFLMPIAVVDSIHILSEFHDRLPVIKDRKKAIFAVMKELMIPMLFTSLTSAVGFASLIFTPIPPVRVFGGFVAFGIIVAWVLTMVFIPAYIMILPERTLRGYGRVVSNAGFEALQRRVGLFTARRSKAIVLVSALLFCGAVYGVTLMTVNDNPVNWFGKKHPIRVADDAINSRFGGTYMAYLILDGGVEGAMKSPAVTNYISGLQKRLAGIKVVGKTTSYVDVLKKISFELHGGDQTYMAVPDTARATAQYLFLYEMSGNPDDLYHLVDPGFTKANIWVQLKSGDNKEMRMVEASVARYMADNPPPGGITASWAGLTYLNVVWQDRMVSGMLRALASGAILVFLMMVFLFRSLLWGFISMIPLSLTIAVTYGLVGYMGKDYDMPIAVLSSLTLGISVDFAIHLCQRMRQIRKQGGQWAGSINELFGESVRAILKNMVVIAIGFSPMFFAKLTPYRTVGFFFASIMTVSGIATLLILPAIMKLLRRQLKLDP